MSTSNSRGQGRFPLLLGVALAVLIWPRFAWAYLDPGTGSYLFQMAIGSMLAGMFTMRLYWQKIKDWVRRTRSGQVEAKPDDPPPAAPPPPTEPPSAS